jgi:transposase
MSNDDGYVKGMDRTQELILPKTVDQYIDKENPVRFIDGYVDTLPMDSLGFKHSKPNDVGRPPYDPRDLLKLYIHGYMKRMRSSRVLEDACKINLDTIWLIKGRTPDFKTIADFRKDNVDLIKSVFKRLVSFLQDIDLVEGELASLDGSKIKACNSRKRNFRKDNIESRLKKAEERIERYMKKLEKNDELDNDEKGDDNEDADLIKKRNEYLQAKLEKMKKTRDELKKIQTELNESGKDEISLTDPESRLMKSNGRLDVCYNAELAVDRKEKIIVNYDVVNEANDEQQLFPMAKDTKEVLGVEKLDMPADTGFVNFVQIKQCVENGITPYFPSSRLDGSNTGGGGGVPDLVNFSKDKFAYDEKRDIYICPNQQELKYITRSQEKKDADIIVRRIYGAGADVCNACPFRASCTNAKNKNGRIITRWEYQHIIDEVAMKARNEPEKVDERVKLAEHPFATIKRALNQGYFLLRGLRKVKGEMGFTVLAYDIRRALNIMGTSGLLDALAMTAPTGGTANLIK